MCGIVAEHCFIQALKAASLVAQICEEQALGKIDLPQKLHYEGLNGDKNAIVIFVY